MILFPDTRHGSCEAAFALFALFGPSIRRHHRPHRIAIIQCLAPQTEALLWLGPLPPPLPFRRLHVNLV
jgi:hypothetical protein